MKSDTETPPGCESSSDFVDCIRRSDREVLERYDELSAKVMWNLFQNFLAGVENGEITLTEAEKPNPDHTKEAAKLLEDKYGIENLVCDNFELDLIRNKLMALAWVMGAEWGDSLTPSVIWEGNETIH